MLIAILAINGLSTQAFANCDHAKFNSCIAKDLTQAGKDVRACLTRLTPKEYEQKNNSTYTSCLATIGEEFRSSYKVCLESAGCTFLESTK